MSIPCEIIIHEKRYHVTIKDWKILDYITRYGKTSFDEIEEMLEKDLAPNSAISIQKRVNKILQKAKSKYRLSIADQSFSLR